MDEPSRNYLDVTDPVLGSSILIVLNVKCRKTDLSAVGEVERGPFCRKNKRFVPGEERQRTSGDQLQEAHMDEVRPESHRVLSSDSARKSPGRAGEQIDEKQTDRHQEKHRSSEVVKVDAHNGSANESAVSVKVVG